MSSHPGSWPPDPGPSRVSWGPVLCAHRTLRSARSSPVEIFFDTMLAIVCVGVLAFAGLTVMKLYQGQR